MSPREDAAKIARITKVRASLFVQFAGMLGLASRWAGVRAGTPVAAPEVIESFGENTFLAAFSVREGIWLLAVRGGIIIRDKIFSDIAAAQTEYASLIEMPDWAVLAAPTEWNAPSAVERKLADIISGNKKYYLSNISNLPGYILTALVLTAALFAGYHFFREPLKKLFAPRPQQMKIDPKLAEEYRKKLEEIDAPKPKAPKKISVRIPYEHLPKLEEKATQCWHAIAFLSQPIPGWAVDSVACKDGEASAHLLRSFGTIGDLYDAVIRLMPGVVVDETFGNDVILNARLRSLPTHRRPPEHTSDEIMTAVQSVFQRINQDVEFRRELVDLDIPETGENEILDTHRVDVPAVRIETKSKLSPLEFIKIMDGISSVEMPLIKWDNQNRDWIYEAVIYVK